MAKRGFQPRGFSPEALASAKARENDFLTQIMPGIIKHADWKFRDRHPNCREDDKQEALAQGWKFFVSVIARGGEPLNQIGSIVKFAVTSIFYYRFVCGMEPTTDVLSFNARKRHRFRVVMIASSGFDSLARFYYLDQHHTDDEE